MSTFFYHYSTLEEYCNDTIILEGITLLETATNASKSIIANQATSGMCMKHFSIGTEKMLEDRENPYVIKLPENTMVSHCLKSNHIMDLYKKNSTYSTQRLVSDKMSTT